MTDLTGMTFGKLKVSGFAEKVKREKYSGYLYYWICDCDCGNSTKAEHYSLTKGNTKSCGCLKRSILGFNSIKHGCFGTRLYRIWAAMKRRCQNEKEKAFPDYGGRGILLCSSWQEFIPFRDWALSNGYSDDLSIDRKDNDGNYEPSNCRWATPKEQSMNKRSNQYAICNGEKLAFLEISERTGIKIKTLYERKRLHPDISYEELTRLPRKR